MGRQVWFYRIGVSCLLVALSACSTYSLPGSQPTPEEGRPDYEGGGTSRSPVPVDPGKGSAPSRTEPIVVAAYQPLLDQAVAARNRGDYEQSLVLLERAQRIDPDNPDIYLAMAKTHSARGDKAQATAVAQRGLLYCSGAAQCDALRRYAR
ncbi:MAG: tetratricopeptide repeat protein [Halioglobus sp.]